MNRSSEVQTAIRSVGSCRDAMLSRILVDSLCHDVTLRGKDDVQVTASRQLLVSASDVFRAMLHSAFKEASSSVVDVGYTGIVLRAVVEFICTESCKLLLESEDASRKIHSVVELRCAAMFFGLKELLKDAESFLHYCMRREPSLSLAVFAACGEFDRSDDLEAAAMSYIRSNRDDCLSSDAVLTLNRATLEHILKDPELEVKEYKLFEMVQRWVEGGDLLDDRQSHAMELMHLIRFDRIKPTYLITVVEPSRLVEDQDMSTIFRQQALCAEEKHGIEFDEPRKKRPVWKSSELEFSNFDGVDLLEYPAIKSGVHSWEIEVVNIHKTVWLGVALTSKSLDPAVFLGNQKVGWVYGSKLSSPRIPCNLSPLFILLMIFAFSLLP